MASTCNKDDPCAWLSLLLQAETQAGTENQGEIAICPYVVLAMNTGQVYLPQGRDINNKLIPWTIFSMNNHPCDNCYNTHS